MPISDYSYQSAWYKIRENTEKFYSKEPSRVRVFYVTGIDFEGDFDSVIHELNGLKLSAQKSGLVDIYFDCDYSSEYRTYSLCGYRPETDEEFSARIQYIEKEAADQRERDMKSLEELKKKLGQV